MGSGFWVPNLLGGPKSGPPVPLGGGPKSGPPVCSSRMVPISPEDLLGPDFDQFLLSISCVDFTCKCAGMFLQTKLQRKQDKAPAPIHSKRALQNKKFFVFLCSFELL